MGNKSQEFHVLFFPFLAYGHMIPTLDIARLFAARNVKVTIITTPFNAPTFTKAIEKKDENSRAPTINIEVFRFPTQETGLPQGCENLEQAMMNNVVDTFMKASEMLREQLERCLEKTRPNCLVADMFFPWSTDSAAKFNIPRLVFHGISFFSLCATSMIRQHEPYKNVTHDDEPFILPSLPHEVTMTRLQISEDIWKHEESGYKTMTKRVSESELKCYGVIVNSFYELEPDYADFYRKDLGRKAWHIGPVSLCNRSIKDKAQRGKQASIDEHECLKWLDSKTPNSVIYICFGSTARQIASQLYEIASALQASGQEFIWVVKNNDGEKKSEKWLPQGFKQVTQGKGLIIRGWAPQVLILEHEAVGAFLTHCGWNSTLEGISAGVPMVTWPIFAEQFYNEKLVTQILNVGTPIGAKKWSKVAAEEDILKRDVIEKAIKDIMVGDEAEERRTRAKKLKDMAWKAIEEGGSSYSDLNALINELLGGNLNLEKED